MIVHLVDKAKLREKRLHFYQDPVFLIAIDEVKGLLGSLNLIDLFSSAEAFAHYLVKNGIADRELLELEIEDLKAEIESDIAPCADREKQGEKDLFLLLTITFLKLCAMRITHPAAESIARVFVSFCMKYEGYYKLLNRLNCKERKLIQQARLPSILKYELQSIQEEKPPVVEAMPVIVKLVDCCEYLTPDAIQHVIQPLMETNQHYGMMFTEQVERLKDLCRRKSQPVWHADGDVVMSKYVNHEVNSVAAGATGIQVLPINSSK